MRVYTRNDRSGRAHIINSGHPYCSTFLSTGQSWRSDGFSDIRQYCGDSLREMVLTPHVQEFLTLADLGPVGTGGGVSIGGSINDVTGWDSAWYPPGDVANSRSYVSVGRAAAIAYQRLKQRYGKRITPIGEIPAAYPGSTWYTGGSTAGGAQPGLQVDSTPWRNMITMMDGMETYLPLYNLALAIRSIRWTQGTMIAEVVTAHEAAGWPLELDADGDPIPLDYYVTLRSNTIGETTWDAQQEAQYDFCRTNAHGTVMATSPWYWGRLRDSIHLRAYSAAMLGEMEGLAAYIREVEGFLWNPLWFHRTTPITFAAGVFTIPLERPPGSVFALSQLTLDTTTVPAASTNGRLYGLTAKRAGVDLTLTGLAFDQAAFALKLSTSTSLTTGDVVTIGYATDNGVAQINDGNALCGLTGNIKLPACRTVFTGTEWNRNQTIDAWLCQGRGTVTI